MRRQAACVARARAPHARAREGGGRDSARAGRGERERLEIKAAYKGGSKWRRGGMRRRGGQRCLAGSDDKTSLGGAGNKDARARFFTLEVFFSKRPSLTSTPRLYTPAAASTVSVHCDDSLHCLLLTFGLIPHR